MMPSGILHNINYNNVLRICRVIPSCAGRLHYYKCEYIIINEGTNTLI